MPALGLCSLGSTELFTQYRSIQNCCPQSRQAHTSCVGVGESVCDAMPCYYDRTPLWDEHKAENCEPML